jgi:aryl-alcohol dehydrogenase-like predicted oxidoreductase
MNILIQQGKILYWGTSEWSAQEIMEAYLFAEKNHLVGPSMEQPEYNLFNRIKIEKDFLLLFRDFGLGTTIWSPLASGLLTGKYNNGIPEGSRLALEGFEWLKDRTLAEEKISTVKKLKTVADEIGTSLSALAIAWCIKNPNVSTAILGATKKEQLTENLKALDVIPKLSPELMQKIDEITGTKPIQPEY